MGETCEYVLKQALKWIWISIIIALLLAMMYYAKSKVQVADNTNINNSILSDSFSWEANPNTSRYMIFSSAIKPEFLVIENDCLKPLEFLGQYDEIIRQRILSFSNLCFAYQAMANRNNSIKLKYTIEEMKAEMIEVDFFDYSNLQIKINAPMSLNNELTEAELCELRETAWMSFNEILEKDDFFASLPIQLKRATKETENILSEQSAISLVSDQDQIEIRGVSWKKILFVFLFGLFSSFLVIVFVIIGNGKIKTGEEMRKITNLDVYDDFVRNDINKAAESLSIKLKTKTSCEKVYLVATQESEKDAKNVENELNNMEGNETIFIEAVEWKDNDHNDAMLKLFEKTYLILIKQNTTRIKHIKGMARDLSQINAKCIGAIICK